MRSLFVSFITSLVFLGLSETSAYIPRPSSDIMLIHKKIFTDIAKELEHFYLVHKKLR